jgi:small subunit ribosomal protein S4e
MSKHLKRLASPRTWIIPRKKETWVVKASPGPHPIDRSLPLILVIRDFLKIANINAEARRIIGNGEILVDGRVVRSYKYPVGLMDVISIPNLNLQYRVLLNRRGKLEFVKISKEEAKFKLARIENKTTVAKGKIQLNLHDGRNILLKKNKYNSGDVLKLSIPDQKVQTCYTFEAGNISMLIGGHHVGELATIARYEEIKNPKPNIVYFDGFSTIKDYVFLIGQEKPEITMPDINVIEESKISKTEDKAEKTEGKAEDKTENKTEEPSVKGGKK